MNCRRLTLSCVALMLSASGCASAAQQTTMNWQSLSTDALDGSLLADQVVSGRATTIFARAHAQELQNDVDQVELNVSDQGSPDSQRLAQLADQLSNTLGTIVVHPGDPFVARRAGAALRDLAKQIAKSSS